MFVTVVRVILDSYFLRFGDRNPGIRIFPLPLPFFPLLPFFSLFFPSSSALSPHIFFARDISNVGRSYSQSNHHIMSLQCLYILRDSQDYVRAKLESQRMMFSLHQT